MTDTWTYDPNCRCDRCLEFKARYDAQRTITPTALALEDDGITNFERKPGGGLSEIDFWRSVNSQGTVHRNALSAQDRKAAPLWSGCMQYFPDALMEVAKLSLAANNQHNPGQPMHWARGKSGDECDTAARHLLDAGKRDIDGQRHLTKAAWRTLAALQKEIEEERGIKSTP